MIATHMHQASNSVMRNADESANSCSTRPRSSFSPVLVLLAIPAQAIILSDLLFQAVVYTFLLVMYKPQWLQGPSWGQGVDQ